MLTIAEFTRAYIANIAAALGVSTESDEPPPPVRRSLTRDSFLRQLQARGQTDTRIPDEPEWWPVQRGESLWSRLVSSADSASSFALGMLAGAALTAGVAALAYPFIT